VEPLIFAIHEPGLAVSVIRPNPSFIFF